MYYKVTIPKDRETTRNFLLQTFDMLEEDHKTANGCIREISLHCIYDFTSDRHQFYNEDITIYFKVDAMTDEVQRWLNDYKFTPTDSLPNDLKHILGFDYPTTKRLQWSLRYA